MKKWLVIGLVVAVLLVLVVAVVNAEGIGHIQRCVSEHWECQFFPMVLN